MTAYPHDAGEPEAFVPGSLRHLPNPPTFHIRWGTPREKERFKRIRDEEGLTSYSDDALRAELIKGMKDLFSPEDFATWEPRAREWWDAADAFEKDAGEARKALSDPPTEEELAALPTWNFEGEDHVKETLEQVARDWRPFRLMTAANNAYHRLIHFAVSAVIITRAENLPRPVRVVSGSITYDGAQAIEQMLGEVAEKHGIESNPAEELSRACLIRLFLPKSAEKNSASPLPSEASPPASKTGTASTSGKSRASARSGKTPATS